MGATVLNVQTIKWRPFGKILDTEKETDPNNRPGDS